MVPKGSNSGVYIMGEYEIKSSTASEKTEVGPGVVEAYDTRDPAAYQTPLPMQRLSYASRLIQIASSGTHHDVRVDPIDLLRLIVWVDTMCPYRGAEEVRAIDDPQFPGIDWLSIRPRIKTAPRIARPGPVD